MARLISIKSKRDSQAGLSIFETIAALAVSTTAVTLLFTHTGDKEKSNRSIDLRFQLTDVRSNLRTHIDCQETLKPFLPKPVKNCNGPIDIKDKNGSILVAKNGSNLGDWLIKASCQTIKGVGGLSLKATRQDASGKFREDRLTGQKLNGTKGFSKLYPDDARPCSEFFSNKDPEKKCTPGSYVVAIDAEGSVHCESADKLCIALGGKWTGSQCIGKVIPGKCTGNNVIAGINSAGDPICVSEASRLTFYNVKKIAAGSKKVSVCCNTGDRMYACTGSREKNVDDTCNEESCGYIGAVINGNCCTAGVDTGGGTEAIADGMCLRSY